MFAVTKVNAMLTLISLKKLRVVRVVDGKHHTLACLTYFERLLEGSPQNNVTAVPVPAGTVIPVGKEAALSRPRDLTSHLILAAD